MEDELLREIYNMDIELQEIQNNDRSILIRRRQIIESKDGKLMHIPYEVRHLQHDYIVGGGVRDFLLGKYPNDWDLLYGNYEKFKEDIVKLISRPNVEKIASGRAYYPLAERLKFRIKFRNERYLDIDLLYQNDFKKFFKNFDFTINCFAYRSNIVYQFDDRAFEDLKSKTLRPRNICKKGRLENFIRRGFNLSSEQDIVKIIEGVVEKGSGSLYSLGYGLGDTRNWWIYNQKYDAIISNIELIKSKEVIALLLLSKDKDIRHFAKQRYDQIEYGTKGWRDYIKNPLSNLKFTDDDIPL